MRVSFSALSRNIKAPKLLLINDNNLTLGIAHERENSFLMKS